MKVFVSHASADAELAEQLAAELRALSFEVWDGSQVLPGDNWFARAGEALEGSEAMVVLLTPEAVRSPNIEREVSFALGERGYKGRVFPVLAASSEELPRESIPWVLARFHTIRLEGRPLRPEGVRDIAAALRDAAAAA